MKRRVYDLPDDLAQRIASHQHTIGAKSEAEVVRRLLSIALDRCETASALDVRVREAVASGEEPLEVARRLLPGHPAVALIEQDLRWQSRDGQWFSIRDEATP